MTNLQTMYGQIDACYLKIMYYFCLQIIRWSQNPNALFEESIYGWDQTSASAGDAGSCFQYISDLTQYVNEWNEASPLHDKNRETY